MANYQRKQVLEYNTAMDLLALETVTLVWIQSLDRHQKQWTKEVMRDAMTRLSYEVTMQDGQVS